MWIMKNLYINTLNSLSEEEQIELWWNWDKHKENNTDLPLNDIADIFQAY